MENFIPRSNPPQPKELTIAPPSYSVPDVTMMFDSDDSLIWNAGENCRKINKLTKDQNHFDVVPSQNNEIKETHCKTTYPKNFLSDLNKNNINENYLTERLHDSKSHGKINPRLSSTSTPPQLQAASLSHKNKNYNPEHYCSPKQNVPLQIRLLPTVLQNQEVNSDDKMATINYLKNNPGANYLEHVEYVTKPNNQLTKTKPQNCGCCQNVEHLEDKLKPLTLSQNTAPQKPVEENHCEKQNSYILKVIEDQNQHILYLQTIIEKLLQAQTNDKIDKQCVHCKKRSETIMKIASTQTINDATITKTVGTNTDVPWTGLIRPNKKNDQVHICSTKNLHLLNKCNKPCLEHRNGYATKALDHDISSCEEQMKNNSFTQKSVHLDPIYAPPSPEASLHIHPEYHNDKWTAPSTHNNDGYTNEEILNDAYSDEPPLVGESAIPYNERLKKKEAFMQYQNREETSQEEKNGVTFYNKVMINVQQILHRSGGNEKQEDGDSDPMMLHNNQKRTTVTHMGAAGAFYHQADGPTRQLQHHFGISFLDNMTLQDKRRPMPEMFYASDRPINGGYPHDLEILNDEYRRRMVAHQVADSYLASIAHNSPGRKRDQPLDKGVNKQTTECSFATKQFLGKYEPWNY